ncbi:MAG: hypothetical protein ABJQ14_15700 [Hyphomicrobiales bacterium]
MLGKKRQPGEYAAGDLTAAASPEQRCQIYAACARGKVNAATAKVSVSQRGEKTSHS